ncbi:MAG: GPW/gp25 family protein [Candidatus Zixiibacteriota bacterium]
MDYLALPLLPRDGYLPRTNLRESIMYSVGLLLSTRIGSIPFQPDFGCGLWEREYADIVVASKADVRSSLRNAIDKFEKRLYNVSVSFVNLADARPHALGLAVKVSGNYRDENNEERKFEASYMLG